MNREIVAVSPSMLNKRKIGESHTPEKKWITSKIKRLRGKERKGFNKGYKELINEKIILRSKKRIGKGYGGHISLDPQKLNEVREMLKLMMQGRQGVKRMKKKEKVEYGAFCELYGKSIRNLVIEYLLENRGLVLQSEIWQGN